MIFLNCVREVAKVIQMLFLWYVPCHLARIFGNTAFLWLLLLSLIGTFLLFFHYEHLAAMEKVTFNDCHFKIDKKDNTEDDGTEEE